MILLRNILAQIKFDALFCEVGSEISSSKKPMALMNNNYLVMIPKRIERLNSIQLCVPEENVSIIEKPISIFLDAAPYLSGLYFAKIELDDKKIRIVGYSKKYIQFLFRLLELIQKNTVDLVGDIYNHLMGRQYDGVPIAKMPVVQSEFSKIIVDVENLMELNQEKNTIQDVCYQFSAIISILQRLIKLFGARSILSNSIAEFSYHIFIFSKFIDVV